MSVHEERIYRRFTPEQLDELEARDAGYLPVAASTYADGQVSVLAIRAKALLYVRRAGAVLLGLAVVVAAIGLASIVADVARAWGTPW